jgi:hypothetical protein
MMRSAVIGLAAVGCLLIAGGSKAALIVDNFNVTNSASALDTTAGGAGTGVSAPGSASTEGIVMGGDTAWSRTLYGELTVGDRITTENCAGCQRGHITATSNSEGLYHFRWSGPAKDVSGNTHLQFDWSSDAPGNGTQVWLDVTDSVGTVSSAAVVLTPGPLLVNIPLPVFAGARAGYAGIVDIRLRFDGTVAVDGDIDNVALVRRSVDIEKLVSVDNQMTYLDADVPTGPSTTVAANVFFRLVVTNDGDETLNNITLSDTDFDTSGCAIPATLASAATFACVLGPYPAANGQHSDTATVNARGQTTGTAVSDADAAHYVASVITTAVDIEKLVSVDNQATFADADTPSGPSTSVGANVFFRLVIANLGNEALANIALRDTDFDTSGCNIPATLAPAASFTCVLGPFATVGGQHSNTASVNARGQISGTAVSDADPAHYVATFTTTQEIPTLSQWGTLLLAGLVGLFAMATVRSQRRH